MEHIKSNIHNLKKNNFHDVVWLSTGEHSYNNNIKPINYIQLDKRKLKVPYYDLNNGFNCTLNYSNFVGKSLLHDNTYKIKSLDDKLLDVDYKNNKLFFTNENDKDIYNSSNVILISGSYIFKCKIISTATSELIDNKDIISLNIISVFEKDSSMNYCLNCYRESNISNKYKKFVSFSENFDVNISDDPTLFTIENMNIIENSNTLKYGDIVLTPYKHSIKHSIQGTIIPLILPFAKI